MTQMKQPANTSTPYTEQFFADLNAGSEISAKEIVPHLRRLSGFKSVVDVGCGTGCWLQAFKAEGITDVLGLDGDYALKELQILKSEFRAADLTNPPPLGRTFDLAISLEVAEHLPPEAADGFVEYLSKSAPIVLFSAAIPGQGGTNHLNEQWQDYWAEKFERLDFVAVDCMREPFWQNPKVMPWYPQNMLLYIRKDVLADYSELIAQAAGTKRKSLSLVHPRIFAATNRTVTQLEHMIREFRNKQKPENRYFLETVFALPSIFAGAVKRAVRK
jgi:SAM-dependent methyltransferase